jgi:hypothetical protein
MLPPQSQAPTKVAWLFLVGWKTLLYAKNPQRFLMVLWF